MRPSLQNIEQIDKYLNGKLSAAEKVEFENILSTNPELQEQVELQKDLIRVANRMAVKKQIAKVAKANNGFNFSKWIIGGSILLSVIIAAAIYFNHSNKNKNEPPKKSPIQKVEESETASTLGEENVIAKPIITPKKKLPHFIIPATKTEPEKVSDCFDFNGLKTWVEPDVQTYNIDPAKGAIVEGKEGTLIIIPKNAFINDNNEIVNEPVQFELVEALTLEDMVLYNLGTTSNGTPLESGGMLHIKALCSNKEVKINPAQPLYIEVPTHEVKPNMLVFEGKTQMDGKLNWENPKSLKKYLVRVPLKDLDFLPEGFAAKVKTFMPYENHKKASKELVDSLYYSLANPYHGTDQPASFMGKYWVSIWDAIFNPNKKGDTISGYSRDMSWRKGFVDTTRVPDCGINPFSIATIKQKTFAKSYIATKEFEERIAALHKLDSGDAMLKIYIDNLNKDLFVADSLVAEQVKGEDKEAFLKFYQQKCSNTKEGEKYQDQLSKYYNQKTKEYKVAQQNIAKEWENKKIEELNKIAEELKNKDSETAKSIENKLPAPNVVTGYSYSFNWASTGWVNIDAYLHSLSKRSKQVNLLVKNPVGTTEIYQWLNTINNLTPLVMQNNQAKALFPEENKVEAKQMRNTFCFAIAKNGNEYQWFEMRYNPYEIEQIEVNLSPSSIEYIRAKLKEFKVGYRALNRVNEMEHIVTTMARGKVPNNSSDYGLLTIRGQKRINIFGTAERKARQKQELEMRNELRKAAFKCYDCISEKINIDFKEQ